MRGRAADRSRYVAVDQLQAVIAADGSGLGSESNLIEDGIHEVARRVASKRTAGAVRSVGPGSQTEQKHTGMGISESRYRTRPIIVFAVRLPLYPPDLLSILDEPRALRAGDDFFVENHERR